MFIVFTEATYLMTDEPPYRVYRSIHTIVSVFGHEYRIRTPPLSMEIKIKYNFKIIIISIII